MISMDGGFDNSNWSFHDKRCHTSGNRNVIYTSYDGHSDIHNLPFSEIVRFNDIRTVINRLSTLHLMIPQCN